MVDETLLMRLSSDFSCGCWIGKEGRVPDLVKSFRRVENLPELVELFLPSGMMLVDCSLGNLWLLFRNIGLYLEPFKCCAEVGQDGVRKMEQVRTCVVQFASWFLRKVQVRRNECH